MNAAEQGIRIGSKVSYQDMANPLKRGVVCDIETTKWGTSFVIAWENDTISESDCRQSGWRVLA
jgi:hypothetical protein